MIDILVIGSGPAGLTAAIYARRANLDVLVIEKEYEGSGQIAQSSRVDNYPGFYGINGYELGEHFLEHARALEIEIRENEILELSQTADEYIARLDDGTQIEARTVIYAAGAVHRPLTVPGSEKYQGRGISYCASCDGAFYKGKDVAVIGGGDTALDDALLLSEICHKVYLVHRRDQFRGQALTLSLLEKKENVEIIRSETVAEIAGDQKVRKVHLASGRELDISGVFAAIGMVPQTQLIRDLVSLDEAGYVIAGEDGITDREGLFVAGDIRKKALRQVITAASDGANAAYSAANYLLRGC